jgi:hypothetical protein
MFDACDPMLETRLAETTEAMLACLHEPRPAIAAPREGGEQRIESVLPDELRALPTRLGPVGPAPDLDRDLTSEYLGVLTDTCALGDVAARQHAVALLRRDFAGNAEAPLPAAALALWQQVQQVLAGASDADQELLALCAELNRTLQAAPADEEDGA